jgi:hypothetical protein
VTGVAGSSDTLARMDSVGTETQWVWGETRKPAFLAGGAEGPRLHFKDH